MEDLHAKLAANMPTIVLGDFNEGAGGGAISFLQHQHFTDALGEFDATTSSWQGQYKGVNLADRPDHVMYSAELRCTSPAL